MKKSKLLNPVKDVIRVKHYSIRTEQAYVGRIKDYIFFHNKKYASELSKRHISEYLTYLSVNRNVAASIKKPSHECHFIFKQKPAKLPVIFIIRKLGKYFKTVFKKT